MARDGARRSDKAFERFGYQLFELVPQLDRICVTTIENDRLRLKMIARAARPADLAAKPLDRDAHQGAVAGRLCPGRQTVVSTKTLSDTHGSIMAGMASKDIRSSMHVPVTYRRQAPATINFWSAEAGAFPPEAVKILEEVARLMTAGTAVAQN